jgi:hypothetical protein
MLQTPVTITIAPRLASAAAVSSGAAAAAADAALRRDLRGNDPQLPAARAARDHRLAGG